VSAEALPIQSVRVDEDLVHHLKLKLPDLLPARMLNEFVYCPRLFFYEWVEASSRTASTRWTTKPSTRGRLRSERDA